MLYSSTRNYVPLPFSAPSSTSISTKAPQCLAIVFVSFTGLFWLLPLRAQNISISPWLPEIPQRDYLAGDYDGIRTRLYQQGIDLFANYQGEEFGNVSGGAVLDSLGQTRQVASYDGLLTFGATLDFDKLIGWLGAKLYFSVLELHGSSLTQEALGDIAGFSNIYGYNTIRLGEVYLEQSFFNNQFRIQVGQLLSHDDFFGNSYEELFINGTLDEFTLLSANLPDSPLFPMATPGVKFDLEPGKTFFLKAALFSGSVQAQSVNRHSVAFPISKSTGAFLFNELGFHLNSDNGGLPGTYAVAAFYHTGTRADVGYRPGIVKDGDYGIFFIGDQMVWRQNNEPGKKGPAIGVWSRIGGAPAERNLVTFYADGGVSVLAPLPGRNDDVLAIGAACSKVSHHASQFNQTAGGQPLSAESVLEVTYNLQLAPWWQLQPDIQYYLKPSAGIHAANAAVLGLRTTVTF
ncbi:MAG: carbohydrate porin [Verrucomicrobia bacterium]|nr:carbohydrate porin [Verrucomicrobiota bacterium]